jgi:hypothetical protein
VQIRESRPKVTLVARMAASVANYDYIMDWEFQMDGLIRIKVPSFPYPSSRLMTDQPGLNIHTSDFGYKS